MFESIIDKAARSYLSFFGWWLVFMLVIIIVAGIWPRKRKHGGSPPNPEKEE